MVVKETLLATRPKSQVEMTIGPVPGFAGRMDAIGASMGIVFRNLLRFMVGR
jgi:hypothetical protein